MGNYLNRQSGQSLTNHPYVPPIGTPVNQYPYAPPIGTPISQHPYAPPIGTPIDRQPKRVLKRVAVPWTAQVHKNGRTRVSISGYGMLPYVGENQAAIQEQLTLANKLKAAGVSRQEMDNAMKQLAQEYRNNPLDKMPPKSPVIEEQ